MGLSILKSKIVVISVFFLIFFLNACEKTPTTPSINNTSQLHEIKAPYWIQEPQKLTSFEAVGMSPVNFQGMHVQRTEAITHAREILAQRIHSYIGSVEKKKLKVSGSIMQKSYLSITEAITEVLLHNSYQADAYTDKKNNLFVLVRVKFSPEIQKILGDYKTIKERQLTSLRTKHFSIEPLLKKRCYSKSVLLQIQTKSPMYHEKPIWFYRPNYDSKNITGIGIAEQVSSTNFISQKNTAEMLAKLSIVKRVHTFINSYNKFQKIVLHDKVGKIFDWRTETKSADKVDNVVVKDIWMSPVTCELYIWSSEK